MDLTDEQQLPDDTLARYEVHSAWLSADPYGAMGSGFTYSQGWVEQCQNRVPSWTFSDEPTRPFPIIDFKPTQGKIISDFLPPGSNYVETDTTTKAKPTTSTYANKTQGFNSGANTGGQSLSSAPAQRSDPPKTQSFSAFNRPAPTTQISLVSPKPKPMDQQPSWQQSSDGGDSWQNSPNDNWQRSSGGATSGGISWSDRSDTHSPSNDGSRQQGQPTGALWSNKISPASSGTARSQSSSGYSPVTPQTMSFLDDDDEPMPDGPSMDYGGDYGADPASYSPQPYDDEPFVSPGRDNSHSGGGKLFSDSVVRKNNSSSLLDLCDDDSSSFYTPPSTNTFQRPQQTPPPPQNFVSPLKNFSVPQTQSEWAKRNFPWSPKLDKVLLETFGFHHWRENQREIMNATLSGRDVFVTMPTGGGKSLCYQIPAAASSGVTLVISPLVSLIQDQVMLARALDLEVDALGSNQPGEEVSRIWRDLCSPNPKIRLLFVTPEKISASEALIDKLTQLSHRKKLDRFVIDEAHCVSQWGHDFRPDYCKLSRLKSLFPEVPILAMTATATPKVKKDILQSLGMAYDCVQFSQSFNRENLWYELKKKTKNIFEDMVNFIQTNHKGKCGIIYCLSRRECEELAEKLKKEGLSAAYYHAGDEGRADIQDDWSRGRVKIVVATIAFGMGINKPDVRFVIHYSMPKSLEGYYQESGRAGRDGKPSDCIMYYHYKDKLRLEKVMELGWKENNVHFQAQQIQRESLNRVVSFCENTIDCRRIVILQYFGESFDASKCKGNCDNCSGGGTVVTKDLTKEAKMLVEMVAYCVQHPPLNATIRVVAQLFKGSKEKSLKKFDQLPYIGSGTHFNRDDSERLIHDLVSKDVLRESTKLTPYGASSFLVLGPKSDSLRQGRMPMVLQFREGAKTSAGAKQSPAKKAKKQSAPDTAATIDVTFSTSGLKRQPKKQSEVEALRKQLEQQLRALRDQIAKEDKINGVKAADATKWLISDEALKFVAEKLPQSLEAFAGCEGIGNVRAQKHGARFVIAVMDFCEKNPKITVKEKQTEEDHPHPTKRHQSPPKSAITNYFVTRNDEDDFQPVPIRGSVNTINLVNTPQTITIAPSPMLPKKRLGEPLQPSFQAPTQTRPQPMFAAPALKKQKIEPLLPQNPLMQRPNPQPMPLSLNKRTLSDPVPLPPNKRLNLGQNQTTGLTAKYSYTGAKK